MYINETSTPEVATVTESLPENEQGQNWFEQWLDDNELDTPERGQFLQGNILHIDEDSLLVDVGMKRDAIVTSRDLNLLKDEILTNLSVGDDVVVYVLRKPVGDEDLLVSLNKGLEYGHWQNIERVLESGETLDLEVTGYNKGGLIVRFRSLEGFIPYSHVPELKRTRDRQRADEIKRNMVGTTLTVKPIEVERERHRLIFSAEAAQEDLRRNRLEELEAGQIVSGPVVSIVKFGVFVDLDGVDGLVHISRLDWQHVKHPGDILKVGDVIDVRVVDVNVDRERVSLDRKALLPGPWEQFQEQHQPGDTLEGKVTNVVDFGAFVELTEGVEGLVHVSELGYTQSENPTDIVRQGETILVRVLSIEPERERVSLSMRQVPLERQLAWSLESDSESGPNESETAVEAEIPVEEEAAVE